MGQKEVNMLRLMQNRLKTVKKQVGPIQQLIKED